MTMTLRLRRLAVACSSALWLPGCSGDDTSAGDDSSSTGNDEHSDASTDDEASAEDTLGPESSATGDPTVADSSTSASSTSAASTSTTEPPGTSSETGTPLTCVETTNNCVAPDDDCSCVGCVDDGICGADDDCVCDDCDTAESCAAPVCVDDGLCNVFLEGCVCADCAAAPECDDFMPPSCGNDVCEPGEDLCSCPGDCGNDPNACEPCECGGSGGEGDLCFCDDACFTSGDCCANICDVTACGPTTQTCVAAACGDGLCDPAFAEDSCSCLADCPDDPNACSSCECGGSGGEGDLCSCDEACFGFGDCCANVCAVDACALFDSCYAEIEMFVAGPGLGLGVDDDTYDGSFASMSCATITVDSDGIDVVGRVDLDLAIDHTWVGDLTIKVQSPVGTVVTVLNRSGAAVPDDGTDPPYGSDANLSDASPIAISDFAATSAESMGEGVDVVCLDDGICEFRTAPDTATPGDLSTFAGEDSVGDWQVCFADSAGRDVGTVDTVTLTLGQNP